MRKYSRYLILAVPLLCLVSAFTYFLPPVHERLAWRVDEAVLAVKYKLNPPAKAVFVPQPQVAVTLQATLAPTSTPTPSPTQTNRVQASEATLLPTPEPSRTPIPETINLEGVRYTDQHGALNYCAPANLTMALSFWGFEGERNEVGKILKPDYEDKNVMPYEMADYALGYTDLKALVRVGGDLESARQFIAAGFPLLVEKGTYLNDLSGVYSWMGHYQVLTGYNEPEGYFIAQDSYTGPDWEVPNDVLIDGWRAFNYTYLIIYPPDKEAQVLELLGSDADEYTNFQNAAVKASNEIPGLSGIELYFAWFNRGASLMRLQDYGGAAAAFDEAFAVYPTIPEAERPWRTMWYRTEPYFAYYYIGRYWDVIYLANTTLDAMQSEKNLEESYYWRGMAEVALGDTAGAIRDFQKSLEFHPDFEPALYQLSLLGVENP